MTTVLRQEIVINGVYDEPTVKAVEAYRVAVGLPASGGTDNAFWATFDSKGASSSSFFLSYVPLFLQQTGLSFDELFELLTTQFFVSIVAQHQFVLSVKEIKMQTIAATKLKNKLGEVIDLARREPVMEQHHGRAIVVILDHAEFLRLRELEDSYWAQRAEEAKRSGFLTPEETMTRLQAQFRAEAEG